MLPVMAHGEQCRMCPNTIPETRHPNAVTCSDECGRANENERARLRSQQYRDRHGGEIRDRDRRRYARSRAAAATT